MEIDRRAFIASLGGPAAVALMDSEAKADALEHWMEEHLDEQVAAGQTPEKFPTVAELEAQIENRNYRRGAGSLFVNGRGNVKKLEKLPKNPTIQDFFRLRFAPANHVLQSATRALKTGMSEEVILACLLHDCVLNLIKPDHGWWGAQLFEPYIPEKSAFAIRYHQTLRFYADSEAGYEYPDQYYRIFGQDYTPPPHIEATYKMLRNHKWYMEPRLVTVNDLYAFDPNAKVSIEPFEDIIGRHFKQPKEGLGNDNSPSAHMWRTIANPGSATVEVTRQKAQAERQKGRARAMNVVTRASVATGIALLLSVGALPLGLSAQGAKANYKGLEITVTGVERAMNVSLKDCPPGSNTVRGNTKPGEEFANISIAFKVTPAFKETMMKKPVLVDADGKAFNTSVAFVDPASVPEYTCAFPFRVPTGTKLGKLQIESTTIDLSSFNK